MEKFFRWIIAVFLIIHGSIFIITGITNFLYNPDENKIFLIFPLIGSITLLIGVAILVSTVKKNMRIKKLHIYGNEVEAEIIELKKTIFRVNRRYLYQIVAKDSNGNIYYSEAKHYKRLIKKYKIGDKVNVLVSPDNLRNYFVVLEI